MANLAKCKNIHKMLRVIQDRDDTTASKRVTDRPLTREEVFERDVMYALMRLAEAIVIVKDDETMKNGQSRAEWCVDEVIKQFS